MPYLDEIQDQELRPSLRLHYFVRDMDEVLEQAVNARFVLLAEDLREPIAMAYTSCREMRFPEVVNALEAGNVDLETYGLAGPELDAKLVGYVAARRSLIRFGGWKALKRALRWMNLILKSLGAAFPPGEALREIKDAVENGMKDVEEFEAGSRG